MASNLITSLPVDTQVWKEINEAGQISYYLVYQLPKEAASISSGLENFTFRYKVNDLNEISIPGQKVVPDVTVTKDGDIYNVDGKTDIDAEDYANSFYFGTHTQLAAIHGNVEEGSQGYEYFIEALNEEAKTKPWIFSKDAQGRYDYLAVVLEAAKEGRTARESDFQKTTWWKTHNETERQQIKDQATDPKTWEKNQRTIRDSIMTQMIAAGIQSYPTAVINMLVQKYGTGEYTDDDVSNVILKLANPRLRYELDTEIQGALAGQTLSVIESTKQIKDTIDAAMGPGASNYYNLEDIANERQANPQWYNEVFLTGLAEQFQSKYTQYAGTNVKRYEDAAPEYRYEWEAITGQKANETSAVWKKFMATNDVKEREDIAFEEAARLGTQTYRDRVKADLTKAFGQAGQRATGGGRYQ